MSTPPYLLLRARELVGRPVVTLAGDLAAEVKDVVFDTAGGRINGFTMRNKGLFSRSRKDALPWRGVVSVGRDAVMIRDTTALVDADELAPGEQTSDANVLDDRVLTDSGRELGTVVDVIVAAGPDLDVVGYEIETAEGFGAKDQHVFIPLPDTLAVSGENLIVPASAEDFVAHDLAGFGAAVEQFRAQLSGGGR